MPSSGKASVGVAARSRGIPAPGDRDKSRRVFLSAGEVSGDRLGAGLACALRALSPQLSLAGCAGPAMRAAGVQAVARSENFAVQGWEAVVLRLPVLAARVFALRRALLAFAPDLLVLIDSPGLNRALLATARRRGIPVFWLAPPQLWAWRNRPAPYLRGLAVQPLFDFERDALVAAGADASWHGVPDLLRPSEDVRLFPHAQAFAGAAPVESPAAGHFGGGPESAPVQATSGEGTHRGRSGFRSGGRPSIAILPGSRPAIRRAHVRLFLREALEAAAALDLDVVLVQPHGGMRRSASPACSSIPVCTPAEAFDRAALALSVPGTGCLEAALAGVPAVIAACPGGVDLLLARRLLDPGPKALPNRLLGARVLPEIFGREARKPGRLAAELVELDRRRDGVIPALQELHGRLGPRGGLERAAETCLRLLGLAGAAPPEGPVSDG